MADGEEGEGEEEGEEGEKRLVDLRRSSLMASPQVRRVFSSKIVTSTPSIDRNSG